MLTRLRVKGFKNLVDVDLRFGPLTCITGENAVGKSNLFDAIRFLSALANRSLAEAALAVRSGGFGASDLRGLFHNATPSESARIILEAELLLPSEGEDELGQTVTTGHPFERYLVELRLRPSNTARPGGDLELVREEFTPIPASEFATHLLFPHSSSWRNSVLRNAGPEAPILTAELSSSTDPARLITLHDEGKRNRQFQYQANKLARTVLSTAITAEHPTLFLARNEMQSWRTFHLEPAALRAADTFDTAPVLASDGAHLPATLYRLAHKATAGATNDSAPLDAEAVYAWLAGKLAEVVNEVRCLEVDRDEVRGLLTLVVEGHDRLRLPAQALSEGTLRLLGLAALAFDPEAGGLVCIEEPENGVHPSRISAVVRLLREMCVATDFPSDVDNPLRQIVFTTHSPAVVRQLAEDEILIAEGLSSGTATKRFNQVKFGALAGTWRTNHDPLARVTSIIALQSLLGTASNWEEYDPAPKNGPETKPLPLLEREDARLLLALSNGDG